MYVYCIHVDPKTPFLKPTIDNATRNADVVFVRGRVQPHAFGCAIRGASRRPRHGSKGEATLSTSLRTTSPSLLAGTATVGGNFAGII